MAKGPFLKMTKIIVSAIVLVLLIYGLYWLWQRQPRPAPEESPKSSLQSPKPQESSTIKPKDFTVTKDAKITISGTLVPDSFVAINSNFTQAVTSTQKDGQFEKQIELTPGLNQLEVVNIAKDNSRLSKQNLNYYYSKDQNPPSAFYAGTIKNLFDTLLTVSTSSGDKKAKTNTKTKITLPKDDNESSSASLADNARIGDFALALGSINSEEVLDVNSLEIIRDNKPQITEQLSIVTVLTTPKSSIFNAKEKDSALEFSTNTDTEVQINGNSGKTDDIKKDKKALVFSHSSKDKKIADLVYILP